MKNLIVILGTLLLFASCATSEKTVTIPALYTDNIRYCESVVFDGDTMLVANFGGDQLDPLNALGRGYILMFTDSTSKTLIPASGVLSAPKGMLIDNRRLYIADVGKLVVYNLNDISAAPVIVGMPDGELFVNDMDIDRASGRLFITVTNTGNIYSLDITAPESLNSDSLDFYTNILGANGIVIHDGAAYVASYPANGVTTPDNVIYYIDDITQPHPSPLIERPGQYDGLSLSGDGKQLYFTNWEHSEVGCVDLTTKQVDLLNLSVMPQGAARMQLKDGVLYIPDLPASRVITHKLQ